MHGAWRSFSNARRKIVETAFLAMRFVFVCQTRWNFFRAGALWPRCMRD